MTRLTRLATTSAAALLLSGSMAFAQCVDTETTASTTDTTASDPASAGVAGRMNGIAKDGSMAPLEGASDSAGQQASDADGAPPASTEGHQQSASADRSVRSVST